MPHPSDQRLKPGQVLTENWEIKYEGIRPLRGAPAVRAMLAHWPNGTYYASSVEGATVDEARLLLVLQQARAICDDDTAFIHDADELHNRAMLSWFNGKLLELREELEEEAEDKEVARKSVMNRLKRRIKLLEQLVAEWQDEHDYWPEENADDNAQVAREADRQAASDAHARARAAKAQRTGPGED